MRAAVSSFLFARHRPFQPLERIFFLHDYLWEPYNYIRLRIYNSDTRELKALDKLVQYFRALSEEIRLRIIMLLTHGELCVCDIMDVLGEPQSKISRHLSYLKHSGLVTGKRVGVWMHYMLNDSRDQTLDAQIDFMRERLSSLPAFKNDIAKMEYLKEKKRCSGPRPRPGRPRRLRPDEK